MSYDNTDKGVLFRAKERKTDKHPEFTGKINVGGKDYRLAAWVNESKKSGEKFFALKVSEPQQQQQGGQDEGSDIPF